MKNKSLGKGVRHCKITVDISSKKPPKPECKCCIGELENMESLYSEENNMMYITSYNKLVVDSNSESFFININYCPMCGRKL